MNLSNLEKYRCLFPFERVPPNSKIAIYGAGVVGTEYLKQVLMTNYCEVLCMIDKKAERYKDFVVPVYLPSDIPRLDFDYVLIALMSQAHLPQIMDNLRRYGVPAEKIIFVGGRSEVSCRKKEYKTKKATFAYNYKSCIPIAVRLCGGLGDYIVYKKTLMALMSLSAHTRLDIYATLGITDKNFIAQIYNDIPGLKNIFFGKEINYCDVKENYMLALTMNHLLTIDVLSYIFINNIDNSFAKKMNELKLAIDSLGFKNNSLSEQVVFEARAKYLKQNIYTAAYYSDVLNIYDTKVNIVLNEKFEDDFMAMGLKSYITINYGNGRGGAEVSKQWPYEHYCAFVNMFKENYPQIKIVQVGGDDTIKIPNCDSYVMGKDFNIVGYVLKNALFHLDIEGGLVHLATQLGTRCVVLFGPTSVQFYGYEGNLNIVSEKCKDCFGLTPGGFQCVKGLQPTECMASIKPEYVIKKISEQICF